MPSCTRRVSQSSRAAGSSRMAACAPNAKRCRGSRVAPSSQRPISSSGRVASRPRDCSASQPSAKAAVRGSPSHSSTSESPAAATARSFGSGGTSVMSTRRWPLRGSRSAAQLSRSQRLANSVRSPSCQSTRRRSGVQENCLRRRVVRMRVNAPVRQAAAGGRTDSRPPARKPR